MSRSDEWDVVEDTDEYLEEVRDEVALIRMMNRPVVLTWWLLVINIALWGVAKLYGMGLVDQGLDAAVLNAEQITFFTGMKYNPAIADGQWWRLISAQFVHLDVLHLAFNAYGILVLGKFLERCYGMRRILVLYLASGTIGSLASFLLNPAPGGGASGAVYGLVGAAVIFGIKYRDALPADVAKALTIGLVPWVLLSVGIGFIDAIPMDNAAHIGGLVAGGATTAAMASRLRQHQGAITDRIVTALAVVAVAALVWTLAGWSTEVTGCVGSVDDYAACYPELYEELVQADQRE